MIAKFLLRYKRKFAKMYYKMKTEAELYADFVRLCEDYSPGQVAEKLNISRSYVSEILNKRRLISKRIAKYFGYKPLPRTPMERLFIEDNNNSQKSVDV